MSHFFIYSKVCSPSEYTRQICRDLNLNLIDITEASTIEFGFDGCDAIDFDLNVLKSNGGIHTFEKEYAYKAEKYIIISPPERLKASLNPNVQLCLEVVSPSVDSVLFAAKQLGLKAELRPGSAVASYARTPLGNYLIDCYCESWQDIKKINSKLNSLNGVVSTSYFENIVHSVLTLDKNNNPIEIKKVDLHA
ncbi:ribose-5-phosphate isomerase A [Ligilactobacillus salivarius]|uniref:ribose-5-phosphate isomerase n=1 Tax=Ligilactobacillus salivarius TaxID=1624 RepID=A0AAW6Q468_9LACO|nr:ribose-5-phosphate isomerase A [Ligilactobacillus salivarius]MDF4186300.1 ribose-5-phosphate isomerase A [Ligilactobacillus salivarius]MDM8262419.1 ribose-5-phosphate isomerase A [Ligilactobacillus salivarius]